MAKKRTEVREFVGKYRFVIVEGKRIEGEETPVGFRFVTDDPQVAEALKKAGLKEIEKEEQAENAEDKAEG